MHRWVPQHLLRAQRWVCVAQPYMYTHYAHTLTMHLKPRQHVVCTEGPLSLSHAGIIVCALSASNTIYLVCQLPGAWQQAWSQTDTRKPRIQDVLPAVLGKQRAA